MILFALSPTIRVTVFDSHSEVEEVSLQSEEYLRRQSFMSKSDFNTEFVVGNGRVTVTKA